MCTMAPILVTYLGDLELWTEFHLRDGVKKSKWKFKMAFAIRGPTPPPLANWQIGLKARALRFFACAL